MLPYIAHYVIIVQRLARDLIQFCFVSLLFQAAFWLTLLRSTHSVLKDAFPEFLPLNFNDGLYLINRVTSGNSHVDALTATKSPFYIYFEMLSQIIGNTILFNLVKAIFSDTVAHLNNYSDIYVYAQRTAVCVTVENRMRNLPLLKNFYHYMIKKNFIVEKEKVLLEVCQT